MYFVWYRLFRDKLFKLWGMESFVFRGVRRVGGGVLFWIRYINDKLVVFINVVDFIVIGHRKLNCSLGGFVR